MILRVRGIIDPVARQPTTTSDDVLQALRRAGGEATSADLRQRLHVHPTTVRRHLQPLLDEHLVREVRRGLYRLSDEPPVRSEAARQLLAVLEELGYEAHLTGFDLLAPHAHQFAYAFPHLVYGDPGATEALLYELPQRDFVVGLAKAKAAPVAPDMSRVVLLRDQPNADQYGVRGHVAPVEKAWVDTLRETRRGCLNVSYMELGRILRGLADQDADMRYLRRYARQLGYLRQVEDTLDRDRVPETADGQALQAGFRA
jgi:DNA-binding transcriptional ArsR family regulator